jgi:micrococcal nuclease
VATVLVPARRSAQSPSESSVLIGGGGERGQRGRRRSEGKALQKMAMTRSFAATLSLLPVLVFVLVGSAAAEIYTWVDRDGQVHFTDNEALVPFEHRDTVQSRPSSPPADTPPLTYSPRSRKAKSPKVSSPRLSATGGQATVVAVLDGDTIVISGGQKVRYAGLNTPETHHPDKLPEYCGQEAFEANRRLVARQTVRLEFDAQRRDKYGRLLAYVYVNSLFVNAELIRQGYAQVSTYKENQRYHEEFERLQQHAIAARRGLWGGCIDIRMPPMPSKPKAHRTGR